MDTHSSNKPRFFERLSAILLREPEDREQLIDLLHSAHERDLLDADALSITEGALAASEISVRDIMVPLTIALVPALLGVWLTRMADPTPLFEIMIATLAACVGIAAGVLYSPFARQQMLAFQFEKPEHRAIEGGAERVSILHLAPRENVAFQKITAQALKGRSGTACECWKSLLERPDRFDSRYIDDLFSAFDAEKFGMSDWAKYIEGRYGWRTAAR